MLDVVLFTGRGEGSLLSFFLTGWRLENMLDVVLLTGRGWGCCLRVMRVLVIAQPLGSLAWLESLCHEATLLTVEGYSDTPLLLHIHAVGLALLPHLDPGSLLLPSLGARSSVGAKRSGWWWARQCMQHPLKQ